MGELEQEISVLEHKIQIKELQADCYIRKHMLPYQKNEPLPMKMKN